MNVQNIIRLADAIESHEIESLGFNQAAWLSFSGYDDQSGHNCGTVACIAGWAARIALGRQPDPYGNRHESISAIAAEWLELDETLADELFIAYGLWKNLDKVTSAEAVQVLRELAATGKVNWTAVK